MENEEWAERGREKKEENRTQKGSESYAAHSSVAPSISHIANDMVLMHASSGVGLSARMRCWTYFLELRLKGGLAPPVAHSQRMKERC
jgi:hypothetical protein